jgi:ferritin-like metal-binding protein YciE
MAKLTSLEDLLVHELQDIYHAEGQILKALPRMIKAASHPELKSAFEEHRLQTEGQVERLEQAFKLLGIPAKGKKCEGMAGLLEEGKKTMAEDAEANVMDAALIAAAQKVEHYEISAYGTARTMAGQIGLPAIATLLNRSLAEEEIADNLMTQLARELMSEARTGMTKAPKRARTALSVDEE